MALTAAYSARPQYYNNKQINNNIKYQPAASNVNYKSTSSTSDKESQIVRNDMEMKGDGSYHYDFETSNGIKRSENGAIDGSIQGSSSYISPEGIEIKTTYVADETGYHPVGDHIPQIPDYILRALEYIRTHPYVEKDYYTGEVKKASFNKYAVPTTKRAYAGAYNKNAGSHNSKYNFRH